MPIQKAHAATAEEAAKEAPAKLPSLAGETPLSISRLLKNYFLIGDPSYGSNQGLFLADPTRGKSPLAIEQAIYRLKDRGLWEFPRAPSQPRVGKLVNTDTKKVRQYFVGFELSACTIDGAEILIIRVLSGKPERLALWKAALTQEQWDDRRKEVAAFTGRAVALALSKKQAATAMLRDKNATSGEKLLTAIFENSDEYDRCRSAEHKLSMGYSLSKLTPDERSTLHTLATEIHKSSMDKAQQDQLDLIRRTLTATYMEAHEGSLFKRSESIRVW